MVFLFVLVPDAHQAVDYQLTASASLVPLLLKQGVNTLDMTFPFMAAAFDNDTRLFLPSDPHCSPEGNNLIAQALSAVLRRGMDRFVWAGQPDPVRDYSAGKSATLHFDAYRNAVDVASPSGLAVHVRESNLTMFTDKTFAIDGVRQQKTKKDGILELELTPRVPAAFVDLRYYSQFPEPDSWILIQVAQGGQPFTTVARRFARQGGVIDDLARLDLVQVPVRSAPGESLRIRYVLKNGATLLTSPSKREDATQRPLDVHLYPALDLAHSTSPPPQAFPSPMPGDLFNPVTISPEISLAGMSSIEHDAKGTWRWGTGPQSGITFSLAAPRAVSVHLEFNNPLPGQEVTVWANGKLVQRLADLPRQDWMREFSEMSFSFPGVAGSNQIEIRYGVWNGHGATFSTTDATPYAIAFTRCVIHPVGNQ